LVFLSIIVDIYWWGSVTKILICFAYLRNQAKFLLLRRGMLLALRMVKIGIKIQYFFYLGEL